MLQTIKQKKLNIAVVGNGKWSKIIQKNINIDSKFRLSCVITKKKHKSNNRSQFYFNNINEAYKLVKFDCVYVAVDPVINIKVFNFCNSKAIPLILEKPISESFFDAQNIIKSCKDKNNVIFNNISYFYDKNFIKLITYLKKRNQNITKVKIVEGSLGPFRKNIHPIWDWAPHSLGALLKILNHQNLLKIKSSIIKRNDVKNLAINAKIDLNFSSGISAKILSGNYFKKKIRRLKIFFDDNDILEYNFVTKKHILINKKSNKRLKVFNETKNDNSIKNLLNEFYFSITKNKVNKNYINLKIILNSIEILDKIFPKKSTS